MAKYYNPVTDVEEGPVGRSLGGSSVHHADHMRALREGEHLYALCDRLIFKLVVCVDSEQDFKDFWSQYMQGSLMSFDLFALDEAAHQRAQ